MSQRKILYQWFEQVSNHMNELSKPQAFVLAAFSFGLAMARRTTLSAISEALAFLGKPDTVERRLQRFLSNDRIDHEQCSKALSSWIICSLKSNGLVVLLVDETSLGDKLRVMAVSLAYRGKAIPLAWWSYPDDQWFAAANQVELVTTLLEWVAECIPSHSTVLVQADRGIGTSPDLLRAIQKMGFYYLVRVQKQVRLVIEDDEVPFERLAPCAGKRWSGRVYAFKKAGWLECWAVGEWKAGHDEPWLLLTNFPQARGNWYGLRMWQELAFRDFKSTGWNWHRSHVWTPSHSDVLWLVMALAYAWVISMGTKVVKDKRVLAEVSRGKGKRHSVFQLGLRYLSRWTNLKRPVFCRLSFIPHFPIFKKCVV